MEMICLLSCQVYCPDQYGGYVPYPPPPYAPNAVYSAGGQQYLFASPYHNQGRSAAVTECYTLYT